jgi:hypothetical protein
MKENHGVDDGRLASCCKPGGPCYEAGLSWAQHQRTPEPDVIYLSFADGGNIRKWSREPFPDGREFRAA